MTPARTESLDYFHILVVARIISYNRKQELYRERERETLLPILDVKDVQKAETIDDASRTKSRPRMTIYWQM